MRILLVEDDTALAEEIARVLRKADLVVDVCHDGAAAAEWEELDCYDACVLDIGLPGADGFCVLDAWRGRSVKLPVLVLTARDRFADLVQGFRSGADDYLRKPFRNEELLIRLFALIRRSAGHAQSCVSIGGLTLETASGVITLDGMPLRLTSFEGRILRYLLHRRGAIVSRSELSEHIYGRDTDRDFNSLEVVVSRLRRKIDGVRIETVRGEGYVLKADDGA